VQFLILDFKAVVSFAGTTVFLLFFERPRNKGRLKQKERKYGFGKVDEI